mmetsp:Transcript_23007/g.50851  ORF Transcript_23007/g.50851 Transcript_23007/m.50851 type:complete len:85 (+) Transcript_23007:546-800(+)
MCVCRHPCTDVPPGGASAVKQEDLLEDIEENYAAESAVDVSGECFSRNAVAETSLADMHFFDNPESTPRTEINNPEDTNWDLED